MKTGFVKENLDELFNKAKVKPVEIVKNEDRYILMKQTEYFDLKDEVESLRRNLTSMLQIHEGKSESFSSVEDAMNALFDKGN